MIKQVKESGALDKNPSQNCGMSLATWDHTVLPAICHKWTHPAYRSVLNLLPRRDGRL